MEPKVAFLILLWHSSDGISIVRQPENASVIEGQTVEFDCIFDSRVECVWFKKDKHVNAVGRYKYKYGNDQPAVECSLIISRVNDYDNGSWHCSSMADSNGNSVVKSHKIWLSVQNLKIIQHPQSFLGIAIGNNVALNCIFNANVNCSWFKNEKSLMDYGYVFINQLENGRNTRDCSILLLNVSKTLHEGNWTCNTMVNDYITKRVPSSIAQITVKDPSIILSSDGKINVYLNEQIDLQCIFDTIINCKWTHNDTTANIDGLNRRYKKNNGVSTQVCSVIISRTNYNDAGSWRCLGNDISSDVFNVIITDKNKFHTTTPYTTKDNYVMAELSTTPINISCSSTASTSWIVPTVILIIIVFGIVGYIIYTRKTKRHKQNQLRMLKANNARIDLKAF